MADWHRLDREEMHERVLRRLKSSEGEIWSKYADVLAHQVSFNPVPWVRWLQDFPDALRLIESQSLGGVQGHIRRADLCREAVSARRERTEESRIRLFTACQIWGTGTRNNLGPS